MPDYDKRETGQLEWLPRARIYLDANDVVNVDPPKILARKINKHKITRITQNHVC